MRHLKWLLVVVAVAALPIGSVLHARQVAPLLGAISGSEEPILTPAQLLADRATIEARREPGLHLGLANLLSGHHHEAEALAEYGKTIELAPGNRAARVGVLLTVLGRWQTAGGGAITPELAAALAAGRQADPENALYDYLEGAATTSNGAAVTDPAAVAKGLALIRAGNAKPYCETDDQESVQGMIAFLERVHPELNPLARMTVMGRPFPHAALLSRLRQAVPALAAEPAALETIIGMGKKLGARTRTVIVLAVANGLVLAAERELVNAYRKSGRYQAADALQAALTKHEAVFNAVRRLPAGVDERQLGMLDSMMMPSSGWRDYDPGLNRRMEYAFLELVLVAGLSLVLLVISVLALAGACLASRRAGPPTPRIQWRAKEVVMVYLGGLLFPLFAYLLFDRLHFTREFGLGQLAAVVFTQLGAIALLTTTLTVALVGRTFRRKLAGLNMPVVVPRGRHALLGFALVAVFLSCLWLGGSVGDNDAALILLGALGLAALAVFIRSLFTRILTTDQLRLYLTSLAALLLGAVVLLTLIQVTVVHPYFNRNFQGYKAAVLDPLVADEVGATNWSDLRDYFRDGGSVSQ